MSASRPADQLYRRDIVHVHLALSLQTSGGGRSAHSGRKKLRKNLLPRATLKGHAGYGKCRDALGKQPPGLKRVCENSIFVSGNSFTGAKSALFCIRARL
jgi:hypothetical protein